jgi:diguanylate cyclase (GGDEF)-like protein/PAS domain S-box-containing protein
LPRKRSAAASATAPTVAATKKPTTEELYRFLLESVTEYAIFAVGVDGTVASWNPGAEHAYGYKRDEIVGRLFDVIFTPEDIADGAPASELKTARSEGRADVDRWHVRKDGSRFWGTNTVQPLRDGAGALSGYTKIVRDVTERHHAIAALQESEERMRVLLESVEDYAIFSLTAAGTIETWNAGAERLFGYAAREVIGEYFSLLYTRQDAALGIPESELRQASADSASVDERWHVRKDGSRFFATGKLARVRAADSQRLDFSYVKVAHDITARKEMEDAMRHEAFHDGLTGLPNRSLFLEHLRRSIAQALRNNARSYAVFFLDVDNFKLLNDSLGHVLADRVLMAFAGRLAGLIRAEDVVARLGGDEFGILVGDLTGTHEALAVATRIHAALLEAFVIEGHEIFTSASVGIALGSLNYEEPEKVLRDADIAMYAAKTQGRSKSVLFDATMYRDVIARHQLEGELRNAVRNKEFRTVYQPILALENSRVIGFEALVRWDHPSRGSLAPSEFLAIAEESRAIIAIDRWVLRRACRDIGRWQAEHRASEPLTLSVNLSSRQFSDPLLVDQIREVLRDTGFDASHLKLEITENSLMENSASVAANVNALRRLGIELYVDDFGTGYSSLTYLRDLPVSALKIDRSFVASMLSDTGSREIVRSVVTLAHNFDLIAIAEGVESVEQMVALRALNCECGQGYLFSEPVNWEDASALIETPFALAL